MQNQKELTTEQLQYKGIFTAVLKSEVKKLAQVGSTEEEIRAMLSNDDFKAKVRDQADEMQKIYF